MRLIPEREEIVYLLTKVFEKFAKENGGILITDKSTLKHFDGVAAILNLISNALPSTSEKYEHIAYPKEAKAARGKLLKNNYNISSAQIRDALDHVRHPKPYFVEACYIYVYGVGRLGFQKDPKDEKLVDPAELEKKRETDSLLKLKEQLQSEISKLQEQHQSEISKLQEQHQSEITKLQEQLQSEKADLKKKEKKSKNYFMTTLAALAILICFILTAWYRNEKQWLTLKKDMAILWYKPTETEINSLKGIWLCYTGSPQARGTYPARYHTIVANVIDIKYKNGYFVFTRYGAHLDHTGYMQFESPGLVSVYSRVENNADTIESPRHSLMQLNKNGDLVYAISASWNFDVDAASRIIGIREIYKKQGAGGSTYKVLNSRENGACDGCKIIHWQRPNVKDIRFYIENQSLDKLSDTSMKKLLDEKSIILAIPKEGIVKTTP